MREMIVLSMFCYWNRTGISLDILSDRLDKCRDGRVRTRVGVIGYDHDVVDTDE